MRFIAFFKSPSARSVTTSNATTVGTSIQEANLLTALYTVCHEVDLSGLGSVDDATLTTTHYNPAQELIIQKVGVSLPNHEDESWRTTIEKKRIFQALGAGDVLLTRHPNTHV